MSAYSTVVFDLDGTLLDTLRDLWLSVNHALAAHGLPGRSEAQVAQFTGNGIARLVERSANEGRERPLGEAALANVFDEFRRFYALHCEDHTVPYPGVPELLARLRAAGLGLAVVSNKADFAVQELVARQLPGVFDAVIGECEERGIRKKPDPAMVEAALAAMGRDPGGRAGLVYVGDSEVDLACAANVGCACIACSWGFRGRAQLVEAGAGLIVDTPAELAQALLGEKG